MPSKITTERVFQHTLDDVAIKIVKLDEETYVWIQYGPTEGGLSVEKTKTYTKSEIKSMMDFMEPCGNIPASELFEKFDSFE